MRIRYEAVFFDLFGTLVDDRASAIAGARDCLELLRESRWAIVTSCGTRFARALIDRADLPQPPLLVTADDIARNKPAPDGYLFAAAHWELEPREALVVEDSLQGIAAARQAGMDVVAVLRTRSSSFARAATYVVTEIAALRLLARHGGVELEIGD
jgi:mannitol-1-/sugar-/sorbitol-6-phosphatase